MPEHGYNPEKALDVLLRKLRERDSELARQIQEAIDVGKDVREIEPAPDRRKKSRVYRKTVPFSYEEALQVALDALQAHFVEQPLFVESAVHNFKMTAIGEPESQGLHPRQNFSEKSEALSLRELNEEKAVEIELQTETQIEKTGPETAPLKIPDHNQVEEQKRHVARLRTLVDFGSG